jgi:membrane protein
LVIVPIFILIFEIVKRLPWFSSAYIQWQKFIINQLSIQNSKTVTNILNQLIEKHHHIPIITIIFLLITTALMIRSIEEALNDIFEVKRIRRRNIFLSLIIYICVIIITPCLLGLIIYISQALGFNNINHSNQYLPSQNISQEIISYFIEIILLFIFYTTLTRRKFPALKKWIVSFIVVFFIAILKILFSLYLHWIPTYRIIYGALASIPIFFLWIYLCWLCFISGAVLMQTIDILKKNKMG